MSNAKRSRSLSVLSTLFHRREAPARRDGSARPTIFGFLFSGRSSPNLFSSTRMYTNTSIRIAAIGKTKLTYTLTVSAGAYVVSCPALSQIQFDPRDISLDLADDTRSMDRDSRALVVSTGKRPPEISLRLSKCPLTFTLNVHCDVRAKVRKKLSGIVDCGIDTENRDGRVSE